MAETKLLFFSHPLFHQTMVCNFNIVPPWHTFTINGVQKSKVTGQHSMKGLEVIESALLIHYFFYIWNSGVFCQEYIQQNTDLETWFIGSSCHATWPLPCAVFFYYNQASSEFRLFILFHEPPADLSSA